MTLPKIIDNNRRVFLDVIKEIASKYEDLSIATGYWDLEGTRILINELKGFKKTRLLIGREPLIPRHKLINPEPDYPDLDIYSDLEDLIPNPDLKQAVIDIKNLIKKKRLEVRVYRKSFLHAKCYIFGNYDSNSAVGVIGSSNFTKNGLQKNTELNALESDHRIVAFQPKTNKQEVGHLFWFNQFWKDAEVWNGKFKELIEESPVGDVLFSPYETYIKTLYELYRDELDEIKVGTNNTTSYELFEFQKKNVQHLLKKLERYGTAMLADSVGLGKTATAIEVMNHYLDSKEGRKRVVVICPKSLKTQWKKELLQWGIPNLEPIVLQNLREIEEVRKLDDIASVSLFVIDESHNLRKTTGKRYDILLDWIKNNKKAHTLLLTATPINNELQDLTNQILLGTRGYGNMIPVTVIDSKTGDSGVKDFVKAIQDLQKKINKQINQGEQINYEEIKRIMSPIIRSIVVRRTRQGIEKEYGHLIINGEVKEFPKAIPENYTYKLPVDLTNKVLGIKANKLNLLDIYLRDPEKIIENCTDLKHPLDQLDLAEKHITEKELKTESPIYIVFQLVLMLGFIPYRWRIYQTKYYGKTIEQIKEMRLPGDESRELQQQRGIYGIFRTMFLKRLESSARAISRSLETYKQKLQLFEDGLKQNKIIGLKDIDALKAVLYSSDEDSLEDCNDEEIDDLVLDTVDEFKYNLKALKEDLKKERELIGIIQKQISFFEQDDSKLHSLVELLKNLNKEKPAGDKILLFSYFADTVTYLEEKIVSDSKVLINKEQIAFVSTKNRNDADNLASRFSPIARKYQDQITTEAPELKYLFSTDVLSEGQNLQDCGIIINYDLHWNPIRMIQRNGRINRLGSDYKKVYVYNMSPVQKLESYLKLVQRLESKISMINNTIGTDQSVLGETENPIEFIDKLKDLYSEDEEKRIKAMLDMEQAGDFLLAEDDFILDLKKFNKNEKYTNEYKDKIYKIPKGKWGILPSNKEQKKVPEILTFSNLFKDDTKLVPEFMKMDRNGGSRSVLSQLEALQYLKTDESENKRQFDKISCDKAKLKEIAKKPESYVLASGGGETPTGQKMELLRIMGELHYSPDEIDIVTKSFSTLNYLYKKEVDKLVRAIVKAKKENKPYQTDLKKLIEIANELDKDREEVIKPNKVENILFYAYHNG